MSEEPLLRDGLAVWSHDYLLDTHDGWEPTDKGEGFWSYSFRRRVESE